MTNEDSLSGLREKFALAMQFGHRIGLDTYDPFDTKGSGLGMWLYARHSFGRTVLRKLFNGADFVAPLALRRVMRLPRKRSHGGVAHWAQACVAGYRLSGDQKLLDEATECVQWLAENPARSEVGKGWGLPFDWQAFVQVPAGTAIGHSTMSVLNAMLDVMEAGGPESLWEEVEAGCEFLSKGLNQTVRTSGAVALSYTPLDSSQVINTNAEIAAVLAKCGRLRGREDWVDLAKKTALFAVETQNEDASWFYSAPDAGEGRQVVDHYHTGMILDALMVLSSEFAGSELGDRLASSLNRGLAFHLDNHFEEGGCPKMRPHVRNPIDSYSGGESLVVLTRASLHPLVEADLKARSLSRLEALAGYMTGPKMMASDGCFVYRSWGWWRMRLESMRWAQALVCQGLAEYLSMLSCGKEARS